MSRARALRRLAVIAGALLAAACASTRVPDSPDARACTPPANKALHARDYNVRLAAHRSRADAFANCMQARGYTLDQAALDARVLHFEQVKNADPLGGDPYRVTQIYEQQQRLAPELWRKSVKSADPQP